MEGLDFKEKKGTLLKNSNVRGLVSELGGRVTPDFISEVEKKVVLIVKKAYDRAKDNNRNTVMKRDV